MTRSPATAAISASIDAPDAILGYRPVSGKPEPLLRTLVLLSLPILAENILHMLVGVTDTYLAGHLPNQQAEATAAIGTVTYILWFVSLIAGGVATGATAIIARAVGARHRSLANSVCGQTIGTSVLLGLLVAVVFALCADPLADITQLHGAAHDFAKYYFQVLAAAIPFTIVTVTAAACLRGGGDTVTPAIALVAVDLVNMGLSWGLAFGRCGLPEMGFRGIAIGTVVAYIVGGVILVIALMRGKRVRLHVHRLRPHWQTLRRLIKIGLPTLIEGGLIWPAQFAIVCIINQMDATNVSAAAHNVTIRVESFSFTLGLALMSGTATLVGQSLGQKNPGRAQRVTWMAFGLALAVMLAWGVSFALAGSQLAAVMTKDPRAIDLAAQCLFVTAFAQLGFAATLIFGGALRGAGDTFIVMVISIVSQVGLRLVGVYVLTQHYHYGLVAVWIALETELTLRGAVIFWRFLQGGWKSVKV